MAASLLPSIIGVGVLTGTLYLLGLAVYRIYLSPLADVPGPLLARLTVWYETYYDVFLPGRYFFKIREFHEKYGPIVRINPHEVHFSDPDFYDEIYTGASKKREKWEWQTTSFDLPNSAFAAVKHDVHRVRRAALNPFFSKGKVRSLQSRIESVIHNLLDRFAGFQKSEKPLRVDHAFNCLTNDVVTRYVTGQNYDRVGQEDFDIPFQAASTALTHASNMTKHFPWTLTILKSLPPHMVLAIYPDMASHFQFQQEIQKQARQALTDHNSENLSDSSSESTMFHGVLSSEAATAETNYEYLWQNGQVTIIAGTITTSAALSTILLHLLNQPAQLKRLREELLASVPTPLDSLNLTALEQLKYLSAVIQEGLRLSNGASARLERIDPENAIVFVDRFKNKGKKYVIPPGTPMSMTSMLVHKDPLIYEDPTSFKPERWLVDNPPPEKYFHPFAKGTRNCMGINVAYAELYLTLAHIFTRYGSKEVRRDGDLGYLELYNTTTRDIEIVGDGFVPMWPSDSLGVRILVKK